jgi:TolB-like protein/tRNA A-37 threonylcarbamoyl transferase component Bud32
VTFDLRAELAETLGSTFTIERELGGGMSAVFVAFDATLQRRVAVKVLSPELSATVSVERFRREILTAASLQHPNIVPVLSAGEVAHLPYFIMPFVEGESLRARLARGPLSIRETVSIMRDVARALTHAHERGVVHRDIKPDNIILTAGAATVTDFGVAKAIAASRDRTSRAPRVEKPAPGATITTIGTSIGTPAYMAPEQAAGDPAIDHRADLYSLGIVAYEMLTGAPPFHGRSLQALMSAQLTETPPSVATRRYDVTPGLAALVMKCLEKDPVRRPRNAGEIVRTLETTDMTSGTFRKTTATSRRRAWITGGIAVLGLGSIGYLAVSNMKIAQSGDSAQTVALAEPTIAVDRIATAGGPNPTADAALAAGITDRLVLELTRQATARVVAPDGAARVRERLGSSDQGQLTTFLLEGTLQRDGDQIRLNARVVDGTGATRWAEAFQARVTSSFATQDSLAQLVVRGVLPLLR